MAEALQLQQDMVDFKDNFKQEIQDVLERTPLVIKPRKTKVDIDGEDSEAELLPPPILPQVVPPVDTGDESWWEWQRRKIRVKVCQCTDKVAKIPPRANDKYSPNYDYFSWMPQDLECNGVKRGDDSPKSDGWIALYESDISKLFIQVLK